LFNNDKISEVTSKSLLPITTFFFSIIKEIELNNIKHFELSIENDVYKREVILSEHALRLDYKK